jgi:hypothetical protein
VTDDPVDYEMLAKMYNAKSKWPVAVVEIVDIRWSRDWVTIEFNDGSRVSLPANGLKSALMNPKEG